jgi:hypothetical protein
MSNWELVTLNRISNEQLYSSLNQFTGDVAILVTSPIAKASWRFGGTVYQEIDFPENIGRLVVSDTKVNLNSAVIIRPSESAPFLTHQSLYQLSHQ